LTAPKHFKAEDFKNIIQILKIEYKIDLDFEAEKKKVVLKGPNLKMEEAELKVMTLFITKPDVTEEFDFPEYWDNTIKLKKENCFLVEVKATT
jgi:hypothetical protein